MGCFGMSFGLGIAFGGHALPQDPPGVLMQAVNDPALFGIIIRRVTGTIETDFEGCWSGGADSGSDEKAISPNDGTGVAETRNGRLPKDISKLPLSKIGIPGGSNGTSGYTSCLGTSKRWPVGGVGRKDRRGEGQGKKASVHTAATLAFCLPKTLIRALIARSTSRSVMM